MIIVIVVAAILIPVLLGLLFAGISARADKAVVDARKEVEKDTGFNPALTLGYEIKTDVSADEQVKQARLLAARQAAALPRGANARVGRLGESHLQTAWQGVERDPFTAAKIAQFHGWQGVKTGVVATPVAAATAPAVVAPTGKVALVPGKDYPVIEITDDMSPAEKRKARIANSKAKSAAVKAAKADGRVPAAPAAVSTAAGQAVQAAAPAAVPVSASSAVPAATPAAANLPPKPELVVITDGMPPDEKRQARIANSKAKSAYNKALKAAGIDPKSVTW